MRLSELDPHWYAARENGPRVGFTFECPHCLGGGQRLAVAVHEDGLIDPDPQGSTIPPGFIWEMTGDGTWDTISLTPSVDASKVGHWHGFITNGGIS